MGVKLIALRCVRGLQQHVDLPAAARAFRGLPVPASLFARAVAEHARRGVVWQLNRKIPRPGARATTFSLQADGIRHTADCGYRRYG